MTGCKFSVFILLLTHITYAQSNCSITSRSYQVSDDTQGGLGESSVVQELVVKVDDNQRLCSDYYGGQDKLYKCLERALSELKCDIKLVRPVRYVEVEPDPWDGYCGGPMC